MRIALILAICAVFHSYGADNKVELMIPFEDSFYIIRVNDDGSASSGMEQARLKNIDIDKQMANEIWKSARDLSKKGLLQLFTLKKTLHDSCLIRIVLDNRTYFLHFHNSDDAADLPQEPKKLLFALSGLTKW